MTDKEKEILNKIKKLAESGIGGEKINAKKKLEKLMKKFGIAEADLESTNKQLYKFKLRKDNPYFKSLFIVIINNKFDLEKETIKGWKETKYIWWLELTPEDAIEIQSKYEYYCDRYIEDLEIFNRAFISSNDLYCKGSFVKNEELSEQERSFYEKADLLARGLEKHKFVKEIGGVARQ